MESQLSLVSVVLFIASGALVFFLLFLFAKRQIMRFALKSVRKPHISIGADASKTMKEKIFRRLNLVQNIRYEPTLLTECIQIRANAVQNHYQYRMKALDAFTNAVECLRLQDSTVMFRSINQSMQLYLFTLCPSVSGTPNAHIIHQFCQIYRQARHSPSIFGEEECASYMELLDKVIRMIKHDQRRRINSLAPPLQTEVRIRKGKGEQDQVETVPHIPFKDYTESLQDCKPGKSRPEHVEQISLVDKSSGYSSTDHSSSGRGSAERLISPQPSVIQKDEAV